MTDRRDELVRQINNLRSSINWASSECIADLVLSREDKLIADYEAKINRIVEPFKATKVMSSLNMIFDAKILILETDFQHFLHYIHI